MNKHILLVLAALLVAGLMFAQPSGNPLVNPKDHAGHNSAQNPNLVPRPGIEGHDMDMMMELKLSDAQKVKLEELKTSHQKSVNLMEAEIENLHIDIMQYLKKEDFANAKKLTQQLYDKKLAKANARIDHMQMVMKELTPEQKEMGRGMFMNMMGKHGGKGMHKGMMNCPGMMGMNGMKGMHNCDEMKGMKHDCQNDTPKPDPNMPTPKVKNETKY